MIYLCIIVLYFKLIKWMPLEKKSGSETFEVMNVQGCQRLENSFFQENLKITLYFPGIFLKAYNFPGLN